MRYRPVARQFFFGFVVCCLLLGWCGAANPDDPVIPALQGESKLVVSYTADGAEASNEYMDYVEARRFMDNLPADAAASISAVPAPTFAFPSSFSDPDGVLLRIFPSSCSSLVCLKNQKSSLNQSINLFLNAIRRQPPFRLNRRPGTMTVFRPLALGLAGLAFAATAYAAGGAKHAHAPEEGWPFEGATGQFEMDSVQRGYQVYKEVCSSCHGMKLLSYRNLGEPGGPFYDSAYPNANDNPYVKALAADNEILDPVPNDVGDYDYRPATSVRYLPVTLRK